MTRYYCNNCCGTFEYPVVIPNLDQNEVGWSPITYCPICSAEGCYEEMDRCPKCNEWMKPMDKLCTDCKTALRWKFRHFVEFLTAEEEEQMDEWLKNTGVAEI